MPQRQFIGRCIHRLHDPFAFSFFRPVVLAYRVSCVYSLHSVSFVIMLPFVPFYNCLSGFPNAFGSWLISLILHSILIAEATTTRESTNNSLSCPPFLMANRRSCHIRPAPFDHLSVFPFTDFISYNRF